MGSGGRHGVLVSVDTEGPHGSLRLLIEDVVSKGTSFSLLALSCCWQSSAKYDRSKLRYAGLAILLDYPRTVLAISVNGLNDGAELTLASIVWQRVSAFLQS